MYNDWGLAARDVRLLVEGVDANGRVLWQRVERLPGDLTPGTTAPLPIACVADGAARVLRMANDTM